MSLLFVYIRLFALLYLCPYRLQSHAKFQGSILEVHMFISMVVFTLHQLKHEKWNKLCKDVVVQLSPFFQGKLAAFCV